MLWIQVDVSPSLWLWFVGVNPSRKQVLSQSSSHPTGSPAGEGEAAAMWISYDWHQEKALACNPELPTEPYLFCLSVSCFYESRWQATVKNLLKMTESVLIFVQQSAPTLPHLLPPSLPPLLELNKSLLEMRWCSFSCVWSCFLCPKLFFGEGSEWMWESLEDVFIRVLTYVGCWKGNSFYCIINSVLSHAAWERRVLSLMPTWRPVHVLVVDNLGLWSVSELIM